MKKNTRILAVICFCLASSLGHSKVVKEDPSMVKVAVIDTGFDFKSSWKKYSKIGVAQPKLCKKGHIDFTNTGINDTHGHGTHVAGIIAKHAGIKANYCLVIIKTWDRKFRGSPVHVMAKAFAYATKIGVDIINYSGGGVSFDLNEYLAVKKALDSGILIVAAAGNEGGKVDYHVHKVKIEYSYTATKKRAVYKYKTYFINRKTSQIVKTVPGSTYYPAAYDPRIIAVKNVNKKGVLVKSSNHGEAFVHEEVGLNVLSNKPGGTVTYMTGTSQAAPARAGKIVNSWRK